VPNYENPHHAVVNALPNDKTLHTFLDAAKHVQRLSAAAQRRPEWQIAGRILTAHAEMAIRKALDLPAPPR
jgi:hypothetical protein